MKTVEYIRLAGKNRSSTADGPGIRYVVYGQGCVLNCPDCHNPETHDLNGGTAVDISDVVYEISSDPVLDGVTFSGGEPFCQVSAFARLADRIRDACRQMHIICYSGYTFEELYADPAALPLLQRIDLLVDGRYNQNAPTHVVDITKPRRRFRGSSNQRVINVKESLKCGKPIETDF